MKKILFIVLLTAILFGCDNNEENEKNSNTNVNVETKKEIAAKPAGPVVGLRYKFSVGDKFAYKLQTMANNTEEIIADTNISNQMTQNATYRLDFKVNKIKEDKSAELIVKINSIIAESIYGGQSIKYDSKFIYSSREKVQFVDYEAVKKIPFKITVSSLGQVTDVYNIEKIMKNVLDIQNVPDTLSAENRKKMKLNISHGTLMPLTQQIFKVLPENEVGVDSLWLLKYNTPLAVFDVENTAIYKVKNLEFSQDTIASITSTLSMSVSGNNIVNEKGLTYTFAQPKINASGTIKYNKSKGLVELSESLTKLEMSMVVDGLDKNNKPLRSTKIDISNNTNIVELL